MEITSSIIRSSYIPAKTDKYNVKQEKVRVILNALDAAALARLKVWPSTDMLGGHTNIFDFAIDTLGFARLEETEGRRSISAGLIPIRSLLLTTVNERGARPGDERIGHTNVFRRDFLINNMVPDEYYESLRKKGIIFPEIPWIREMGLPENVEFAGFGERFISSILSRATPIYHFRQRFEEFCFLFTNDVVSRVFAQLTEGFLDPWGNRVNACRMFDFFDLRPLKEPVSASLFQIAEKIDKDFPPS